MKIKANEIEINGVKYVEKGTEPVMSVSTDGLKYVIIRTYSAGVFAGYLKSRKGKEVELSNARRLWYWSGAASLSQLAMEGVSNKSGCKFPCEVAEITLPECIEVITCTEAARLSIAEVDIWKK